MKNVFKNKTIILAITSDIEIYKCFVDNLEYLGFKVYLICDVEKFAYKNFIQRIRNSIKKTFFNDTSYKRECKRQFFKEKNLNQIEQIGDVDYSLTIRADLFDKEVLKKIILKSKYNVAYQWDGISRFPEVKNIISLFDKFYVFDQNDLNLNFKTYFTTNFYFDCYENDFKSVIPKFDAFYIGSYDIRIKKLIQICELLYSNGLNINVVLLSRPKKKLAKYPFITYINKPISYYENLLMVNNSKMIIDIHHENLHDGLSFRPFEALGFEKKIITSNKNIKTYDFCDNNNVHIITNNKKDFNVFLKQNYEFVNIDLKYKYSFSNWINNILKEK